MLATGLKRVAWELEISKSPIEYPHSVETKKPLFDTGKYYLKLSKGTCFGGGNLYLIWLNILIN